MSDRTITSWTIEEIESLIQAFKKSTLSRERWTHQAHLIVALWYLDRYSKIEAIDRIRQGIWHYNSAIGIETTPTSGYHETITRFWIEIVARYLHEQSLNDRTRGAIADLANKLISKYATPHIIFEYYSRDRLISLTARHSWVEPDLKALFHSNDRRIE
ncbi:MAG: hypothetical protein KME17_18880 [Cyanosarcina radialis HA8281-LM2]|jgi:hypothetical protein|nr:hypothetical protein [Cyanosarcina radialis HA8281-LM2]